MGIGANPLLVSRHPARIIGDPTLPGDHIPGFSGGNPNLIGGVFPAGGNPGLFGGPFGSNQVGPNSDIFRNPYYGPGM